MAIRNSAKFIADLANSYIVGADTLTDDNIDNLAAVFEDYFDLSDNDAGDETDDSVNSHNGDDVEDFGNTVGEINVSCVAIADGAESGEDAAIVEQPLFQVGANIIPHDEQPDMDDELVLI